MGHNVVVSFVVVVVFSVVVVVAIVCLDVLQSDRPSAVIMCISYSITFAPGDFVEKRVLRLVERLSSHCLAIRSLNLPQSRSVYSTSFYWFIGLFAIKMYKV